MIMVYLVSMAQGVVAQLPLRDNSFKSEVHGAYAEQLKLKVSF